MYNTINIINTAVSYMWKLRVDPKGSHHKKKPFISLLNFVLYAQMSSSTSVVAPLLKALQGTYHWKMNG